MIPEQDVIVAFSIKELFVEIRDEIKAMSLKMDDKASLADVAKLDKRLGDAEDRLAANDSRWAGLRGVVIGTAIGSGVLSGGVVAGVVQLIG